MTEHIYTIPVNKAFDACSTENEEPQHRCPFCLLHETLENDELELLLGDAMMEPDIRIKTNRQGFCRRHIGMLLRRKNRLGLALILESHLAEQRENLGKTGIVTALKGKGADEAEHINKLNCSCYICSRIDHAFSRMIKNAALLWDEDPNFRKKIRTQPFFCLPHYGMWLKTAQEELGKKKFAGFYDDVSPVMLKYFDELTEDVSWFCKKFDYRFENEPWGNSKDSPERAADFLNGEE